ncbi:hypothetical protein POREN0001_0934 [Porphyromonas endodontalis ATCC 35406]|uniref:Uncharacterized protein n=1 Tax=Porphyromonas endodontalis (strain ATCC 35406 / DSM 24491 / JCM 8526 / CCUG 16442 / BCRC 14492 / NCTC 13058 / HG 370) TaxID=553175 RepID=C3JA12_POREA|nr:hypothetical protein POREN0001_0934 [Porphyromonas endodontalis ATCC 35406]
MISSCSQEERREQAQDCSERLLVVAVACFPVAPLHAGRTSH